VACIKNDLESSLTNSESTGEHYTSPLPALPALVPISISSGRPCGRQSIVGPASTKKHGKTSAVPCAS